MKTTIKSIGLVIALAVSSIALGQSTEKKVRNFEVSRTIPASAEAVWKVVGEEYASIQNSHPGVVKSDYINGSTEAGEGCQRVCYFNEKETKYLEEKQVDFDREQMQFKVQIFGNYGLPIDEDYSYAIYKVVPIDANSCQLIFKSTYRTDPAFLGGLVKGKFKSNISDYLMSVEHHVMTGENVTAENIKEIRKKYKS